MMDERQNENNNDIRAVIFDCFGVLVANSWLPFQQKYFSHNKELFAFTTELNWQCDAGQISFEEFSVQVAQLANLTQQTVVSELKTLPTNTRLFEYIQHNLKNRYQIGLLSNVGENMLDQIFTTDQNALFDAVALSFEIGYTKPEPGAYQVILQRLGVEPHRAVFIDDQPRYVIGAQEFGLKAIQYQTVDQATSDLNKALH